MRVQRLQWWFGGVVALLLTSWVVLAKGPANVIPAIAEQDPTPDAQGVIRGAVQERLEGGGYVYLRIGSAQKSVWAAVPASDAKVGAKVEVDSQALMQDFKSNSLGRTFAQIYFGTMHGAGPSAPAPAMGMGMGSGAALPPSHPPIQPAGATQAQLSGTVKEVLDVTGYTYLRLDTGTSQDQWAAVPTAAIKVGDKVAIGGTSVMDGYTSKSLKRTFDKLVFGMLVK